jgi:hypothetical protein
MMRCTGDVLEGAHLSAIVVPAIVVDVLDDITIVGKFWDDEVGGENATDEDHVVLDAPGGRPSFNCADSTGKRRQLTL